MSTASRTMSSTTKPVKELKLSEISSTPVLKEVSLSTRPAETPSVDADVVHVPSYSRWFSWDGIDECEARFLPEFFDSKQLSKNPKTYMYYRNSIIKRFRENPSRKISFTEVRKTLVGDAGSIRRVFDFLETWGLVNYSGSPTRQPLKWEDKESSKATAPPSQTNTNEPSAATGAAPNTSRWCSGCKSLCTIACFASDKFEMTLCARCYVRGNYRAGLTASDLRRVEINEGTKTDWDDKETLLLLEALLHYGDNWKRVAEHVGRSEKECVSRFIKLPFGQELLRPSESDEVDSLKEQCNAEPGSESTGAQATTKRMRLTPLADASHPIMAQAAFLSALVGVEVADTAAQAAVTAVTEERTKRSAESQGPPSNGDLNPITARINASKQLEKDFLDIDVEIARITDFPMKEIQEKIIRFEELDKQVENERKELQEMKDLLYADQLKLGFHQTRREGNVSS